MTSKWIKRLLTLLIAASIAAVFVWLMWPQPLLVDVAKASYGQMEVTVDEEGVNRIREIYVISAPVSGQVGRASVKVGDKVVAGVTPITTVRSSAPIMIDARTRQELSLAVEAAKAAQDIAERSVEQAERELSFAELELQRAGYLASRSAIQVTVFEQRKFAADIAKQRLQIAKSQLDLRQHELEIAQAKLAEPLQNAKAASEQKCCIDLTSPADGVVLTVKTENEQVVPAGTPLVEIGNPLESEIAVDLLSSDAVNIKLGALASIVGWGGRVPLKARVTKIEPSAFTKISALGIEEQRVKTVLEIINPAGDYNGLGHQFRVLARIMTWQSDHVLQIPVSALFRSNGNWAVFKIENGTAKLAEVVPGHMTADHAEILEGLLEGEQLIVHPSDEIENGSKVAIRN
jgi:HlyD family secretion protein